ncbi:hypothetical protein [Actinomadura sp. 6N118]|uniref:hypothetical protein n=1 Tax=Actinomadura sp. 6N118 TaxID=3375151 RepID=UPI0037A46A59
MFNGQLVPMRFWRKPLHAMTDAFTTAGFRVAVVSEIRDNLTARIAEAEREGWLGKAEGLRVSLAATEGKLAQLDNRVRRAATINLGIPAFREIAGRSTLDRQQFTLAAHALRAFEHAQRRLSSRCHNQYRITY